jgi:hypothetical protein
MIREHVDPKTGKIKVLVTKFIEDVLLKRMGPYIKFDLGNSKKTQPQVHRNWPESEKDKQIKIKLAEKHRQEEAERLAKEEKERQMMELELMALEDHRALDVKEIEEIKRKILAEEESKRIA